MAILWDFSREIGSGSPGTTTSYQDTAAQLFYLNGTKIKTHISQVDEGHWQDVDWGDSHTISNSGYHHLSVEHHFNSLVAASAYRDGDVVLLLYDYFDYITRYVKKGHVQLQPNNAIVVATLELSEAARGYLQSSNYSLFMPSNILELQLVDKDDEVELWNQLEVSATSYDEIFDRVFLKAKNAIALLLLDQTFDEERTYTGTVASIVSEILYDAGVTESIIGTNATSTSVTFLPDETILEGLADFCSLHDWHVDATQENKIIVGTDAFIQDEMPIVIYELLRGDTAFSRHFEYNVKPIYSRVCVRRSGASPKKIYGTVPTLDWDVPGKKTLYKDVHDGMSQGAMETLRDLLVNNLQLSGYEETFTTAFRPFMHIGDGVIVTDDDLNETKGIIVDIQHCFGNEVTPHTQFTLRSGGTMANSPPTLTSKYVARLGQVDRTQKLYEFLSSPDRR